MRIRGALLLSLLLHGVLLGAVYVIGGREKPKPAPRVVTLLPVTVSKPSLLTPEPAEPVAPTPPAALVPPPPSPPPAPKARPPRSSKTAAAAAASAGTPPSSPDTKNVPGAPAPLAPVAPAAPPAPDTPPALDLYAGALLVGSQHVESGKPSPADLAVVAEGRLRNWTEAHVAEAQAQGAPPSVTALGERMSDWFAADPASLARHSRLGLGIGALSVVNNYLTMATGPGSAVLAGRELQRGQMLDKYDADTIKGRDPGDLHSVISHLMSSFVACFGACEGFRHDVATVSTIVEVEHDAQGVPVQWRVDVSSGDPVFDDSAVDAISTAARFATGGSDVPTVARTLWKFEAQALRFGRLELLADPGLKPPGKEVPSMSGFLGKTMVVQDVKLLAIRYHEQPH